MTDDPVEEHRAGNHEDMVGVMMCCRHCGDYFIRRSNRQEYYDKDDCQKARNAKNQREFRNRNRMAKAGKNNFFILFVMPDNLILLFLLTRPCLVPAKCIHP